MEKPEQAAEQLFGEALELEGDERRAFLDRACKGERMLRSRVEALLAEHDRLEGFLLESPFPAPTGSARREKSTSPASTGPAIAPGSQLGPYRIEAPLGEGGMGQVFRATDTRLGRPVAIKICNQEFMDRFEQERRSIAAINHPRVCTLHDAGPNYLVMELVEGETLAGRLKRGKLPLKETLRFGAQIAEALAVAHARGIVHRDLKPANIMLTKAGVKVLDFGLAKSAIDPGLTATGHVMGTPAYMAPERLEGKESDARADIYALGLILAEMATGRRSRDPAGLPPALERVVKRCVELDPEDRWQNAHDLEWELESLADSLAAAPGSSWEAGRRPLSWNMRLAGALGVAVLLAAGLAFLRYRQRPVVPPLARVNVLLPEKARVLSLAVSPDGRAIAVVLVKDGRQQIWVRALDADAIKPLAGTDGAADPFWSPDSRSIGFFADDRLKKIDAFGGPVQTLCDALGDMGGTWNQSGDILMGGLAGVQRVSDAGGAVSGVPSRARSSREIWPSFLPDGRHYLTTRDGAQAGIWMDSMDSPDATRLVPDVSDAEVAAPPRGSRIGAILFTRSGALMALPFDMKRLQAAGDPYPVAQGIAATAVHSLAASGQGVVAYVTGGRSEWQYVWRDRQGRNLGAFGSAGGVVMISPDGKQIAGDDRGQIMLLTLGQPVVRQLTFAPRGGSNPIWSPDGRTVAYYAYGNDDFGLAAKPANGAGAEEYLLRPALLAFPKSWSPDGRYILYTQIDPKTGADVLALPVGKNRRPLVVAQTPANEDGGQFSPDGHWIAYTSNESGLSEIYVVPFPPDPSGGKWMVSRGGGVQARWRRDGKELFYISPDWKMMAVDVSTHPTFQSGTPHPLFDTDMVDTGIRTGPFSWDVAPDGKRFLIISPNAGGTSSLNVLLNWHP